MNEYFYLDFLILLIINCKSVSKCIMILCANVYTVIDEQMLSGSTLNASVTKLGRVCA